MKKYLLTGIPRSGTTLSCKILNSLDDVIALHEPISPNKLASSTSSCAIREIITEIDAIERKLIAGEAFEHGDATSLLLDNPIENTINNGLRRLSVKRGELQLPPQPSNLNLVVKQNALFASIIDEAINYFHVVSVIRNPVDVFLSWMNVDLPINRGRIPGGEKFCKTLKDKLDNENDITRRQVYIYNWFLNQFRQYASKIVKYEDIVDTNGQALVQAFSLNGFPSAEVKSISRGYGLDTQQKMAFLISEHLSELSNEFYSQADITLRLHQVCKVKI